MVEPSATQAIKVLGVVPARGGSKGVPRKNLRPLGGQPLLAYTAMAALAAKSLSKVILSTEDLEIAALGEKLGLAVPFLRPRELARDDTPTLPVIQHALTHLPDGQAYDAVCILQPTTPFRRGPDIDACVGHFIRLGVDSVISIDTVPHVYNPEWVYFEGPNGLLQLATGGVEPKPRRQDLQPAYKRTGSIYVTRSSVIRSGSLYGTTVAGWHEPAQTVNIDTVDDFRCAERLLEEEREGLRNS